MVWLLYAENLNQSTRIKVSNPKISIIIPIYNAEETAQDSIYSAIGQTLRDIEIICIDNNSTDNSVELVKKIQKTDSRVKLFFEKKQGAGPARNKGLQEATGEYIFFLDPDDLVYSKSTLEKLYDLAQINKMKIVGGSVLIFDKNTQQEQVGEEKYYFKKNEIKQYEEYQFDWGYWRFIYDRQFLQDNNIKFPPYLRGQDTVFFVKAMIKAKRFYSIKDRVYQYNYSYSSKKYSPKIYEDYEKSNLEVIKIARKNGLKELEKSAQNHRIPLVSIIVPVFNTNEKDLTRCFESIRAQTYENIEVIVIDDGSSQDTAEFIDRFAQHTMQWCVIHQKNMGLSAARNRGYEIAKGEYIQFLDSDDYFDDGLISSAVSLAKKTDAEIVVENYTIYNTDHNSQVKAINPNVFPKNNTFKLLDFDVNKIGTVPYNVWSKLFKKDFLDSNHIIHDEKLFRAEDVLFSYTALIMAKKISLLPESYIKYVEDTPNSNSTTNDKYPTASVDAWRKLYDLLNKLGLYEVYKKDFEHAMVGSIYWHLERLYTVEGIKALGISTQRLIDDIGVSVKNEYALLLSLAPVNPEYLYMLKQKDKQIYKLRSQLNIANTELASYLGVRRSIKLVLGNIKRRVTELLVR